MSDITGVEAVCAALSTHVRTEIHARVQAAAFEIAQLLEEYAKQNHPWQNRTTDTENTTTAFISEVTEHMTKIILTTGTDYSLFLETARSGRWAWLWPAMLANRDAILEILQRNVRGF